MQKPRFNLSRGFSVSAKNDKCRIDRIERDADRALDSSDLSAFCCKKVDEKRDYRKKADVGQESAFDAEGRDDAGYSEDEKDVEKARADRVAYRDARLALFSRNERGDEFRKGSSEGNHGKTDQSIAHPELCGDRLCIINNDVTANHNGGKSARNANQAQKPRKPHSVIRIDRIPQCFSYDEK